MLAWLAIKILPFGSIAFRVNWLSALLAALAAAIFCRTLRKFFDTKPASAVFGSICFAGGCHRDSRPTLLFVLCVCPCPPFFNNINRCNPNQPKSRPYASGPCGNMGSFMNLSRLRRELYRRRPGGNCPTSRRDPGDTNTNSYTFKLTAATQHLKYSSKIQNSTPKIS